ncbi:MAG TPA: hypothetical protein VFG19_08715 [Geobacteraceae bacterium]|nr:hypothetical protein [Geobacteraceae bacterium]
MSERKIVLPVAVTVALFVALLGIRIPDSSRLIKNKQSPRAVFEVQAKEIKEGLDKSGQFFTPGGNPASFAPVVFQVDSLHHEARSNSSTTVASAPARASPTTLS